MTMPHLENCRHSETGWCMDCVKELWEEFYAARIDAEKYEKTLQRTCELLQEVYDLRDVKQIGYMEVFYVTEYYLAEIKALRKALKNARKYAVNKQKKHPLGLMGFSEECGVSPTQMSVWTAEFSKSKPDFVD